jgi:ketosteroid isomerase-like protein
MTAHESARAEIARLFAARADALVRGDAAFFRRLLDEGFRYTNASGAVFDRAGYLAFYLESGRARWQSQQWDDLDVRVHGDVAVATCRLHDRATFDGEPLDARFRSTQVFVKLEGDWRYVAGQTTSCAD